MDARNPKYTANGSVDMEVNHPVYGWIPFTASPNDTEQLGKDLYAQAIAGTLGAIAAYVATVLTSQQQKDAIQGQIDSLEHAQLLPRVTREGLLGAAVALTATQGIDEPTLYAANIAYHKLKDFDAQIVTLRDQMNAII